MASSGFEGFEKRLELVFSLPVCDDGARARHGLRLLPVGALREALDAAQCAVVSAAGNAALDAYVLSESSLFVYPSRAVLKTCGTTRPLRAAPPLLRAAAGELGLALRSCRYSRGSFLFPEAQPFPHADFADEVRFLDAAVVPAGLRFRRSAVMPPPPPHGHSQEEHKWHVYMASASDDDEDAADGAARFTVEVCMTELDRTLARQFYLTPGDVVGRTSHAAGDAMTAASGLGGVNHPRALAFGYAFAPCRYSMNALDGAGYATVHVTPEDGHSYASYECGGGADAAGVIASVGKAVAVFRTGAVSVSVCYGGGTTGGTGRAIDADWVWSAVADAVEPLGLACRSRAAEAFPGAMTVTYQTFTRTPASLDMIDHS